MNTDLTNDSPLVQLKPAYYVVRPLVEAILVASVIFIATFSTIWFVYDRALDAQKAEIRQGLLRTAHVTASILNIEQHKTFKLDEQRKTAEFQSAVAPLVAMQRSDPQIAFLYTVVRRGESYHFVFDSTQSLEFPVEGEELVQVMQVYEQALENEALLRAFESEAPTTSKDVYEDEFGRFISGYVPLKDREGRFVGLLGMDIDVKDYDARLEPIKRATIRAQVAGFFIAFLTGSIVWFLRNFILVMNKRRLRLYDLFKLSVERATQYKRDTNP